MNGKSWKTTLLGVLGIISSLSAAIVLILNGHVIEGLTALTALFPSISAIFAKDSNVTGAGSTAITVPKN